VIEGENEAVCVPVPVPVVVTVLDPLAVTEGVLDGVSPAVLVPDVVVVPVKEGVHVLEDVWLDVWVASAVIAAEGVCVCVFVIVLLSVGNPVTVVVVDPVTEGLRLAVVVRLAVWVDVAVFDRLMDREGLAV